MSDYASIRYSVESAQNERDRKMLASRAPGGRNNPALKYEHALNNPQISLQTSRMVSNRISMRDFVMLPSPARAPISNPDSQPAKLPEVRPPEVKSPPIYFECVAALEVAARECLLVGGNTLWQSRDVIQAVACAAGLTVNDLKSSKRTAVFVKPRQLAAYLLSHLTQSSLPQIGRRLGGRDHTTIIHSLRRTRERIGLEPTYVGPLNEVAAEAMLKEICAGGMIDQVLSAGRRAIEGASE